MSNLPDKLTSHQFKTKYMIVIGDNSLFMKMMENQQNT